MTDWRRPDRNNNNVDRLFRLCRALARHTGPILITYEELQRETEFEIALYDDGSVRPYALPQKPKGGD